MGQLLKEIVCQPEVGKAFIPTPHRPFVGSTSYHHSNCSALLSFQMPGPCPSDGKMAPEQTYMWSLLSCVFLCSCRLGSVQCCSWVVSGVKEMKLNNTSGSSVSKQNLLDVKGEEVRCISLLLLKEV